MGTMRACSGIQWVCLEYRLIHVVCEDERVGIAVILCIISTCEMADCTISRLVLGWLESLHQTDSFAELVPLLVGVDRPFSGVNGLVEPVVVIRQEHIPNMDMSLHSDVDLAEVEEPDVEVPTVACQTNK